MRRPFERTAPLRCRGAAACHLVGFGLQVIPQPVYGGGGLGGEPITTISEAAELSALLKGKWNIPTPSQEER